MNDRRTIIASLLVVAALVAAALVIGPPDNRGRGPGADFLGGRGPYGGGGGGRGGMASPDDGLTFREGVGRLVRTRRFVVLTMLGLLGGLALVFILRADRIAARAARESERLAIARRTARGLAHEIRNPLNAMRLAVDLLAKGGDAESRDRYLSILRAEIDRLDHMVTRFQRLSREIRADLKPGSLNAAASAACDLLEPLVRARGGSLARHLDPEPVPALHDPVLLHEVLVNLVKNAAEAIGPGGSVTVSTLRSGGRAAIEVRDDGPGIPAEVRGRLFELYVTTKAEGSGIGLALARSLTEAQGGRIACRTAPGDTRFTVDFPEAT